MYFLSIMETKGKGMYMYACLVAQSFPTLCDPIYCSLPGSTLHGIFQVRILEWVAISFSRVSSWPRDRTCVSCTFCPCRWVLYHQRHLEGPKGKGKDLIYTQGLLNSSHCTEANSLLPSSEPSGYLKQSDEIKYHSFFLMPNNTSSMSEWVHDIGTSARNLVFPRHMVSQNFSSCHEHVSVFFLDDCTRPFSHAHWETGVSGE